MAPSKLKSTTCLVLAAMVGCAVGQFLQPNGGGGGGLQWRPMPPSPPLFESFEPMAVAPPAPRGVGEFPLPSRRSAVAAGANSAFASNSNFIAPSITQPAGAVAAPSPTSRPTTTTTTISSLSNLNDDDELPTRQPLSRFRPTRAPSDDEDFRAAPPAGATSNSSLPNSATNLWASSLAAFASPPTSNSNQQLTPPTSNNNQRISQKCYECICEASTSCNAQSRCQTSDVRHTRCGMFLISYDQWLASGLSRDLVTREALARDEAADERAFYECVTRRDCAERLLAIYLEKNSKDCDRDARIDCYDLAAIHHSGLEQCSSEQLLDSQYWSDFNACFGFGRRRRR